MRKGIQSFARLEQQKIHPSMIVSSWQRLYYHWLVRSSTNIWSHRSLCEINSVHFTLGNTNKLFKTKTVIIGSLIHNRLQMHNANSSLNDFHIFCFLRKLRKDFPVEIIPFTVDFDTNSSLLSLSLPFSLLFVEIILLSRLESTKTLSFFPLNYDLLTGIH